MSYFEPFYSKKHTLAPGLGKIYSHAVGSTSGSTGFDHYFLPEGADKPIIGTVRFSTYIAENGEVAWAFVSAEGPISRKRSWRDLALTEETQVDFPPAAIAEMRRISETLYERDPAEWFYQAIGALDHEINSLNDVENQLVRFIKNFTAFLANPNEPARIFVHTPLPRQEKGHFRVATPAERKARRDTWQKNLTRSKASLTKHRAEQSDRLALLKRLRSAMAKWTGSAGSKKAANPFELYQAALHVLPEAA